MYVLFVFRVTFSFLLRSNITLLKDQITNTPAIAKIISVRNARAWVSYLKIWVEIGLIGCAI